MLNEFLQYARRYFRYVMNVKQIVKMIALYVLLVVHGYTDSVTDSRWALYNLKNLLCADTFVVTGCLILMVFILLDLIVSVRAYLSESIYSAHSE